MGGGKEEVMEVPWKEVPGCDPRTQPSWPSQSAPLQRAAKSPSGPTSWGNEGEDAEGMRVGEQEVATWAEEKQKPKCSIAGRGEQ